MQNVDWVDFLKLRADYGQVGNDAAAGYYAYMSLYKLYGRADEPSYWIGQLGNNNLKWETSQSFGVAAEARMFNRWNLSVEYFDKHPSGDIISRISYDIDTLNATLSTDLIQVCSSVITVTGSLIMMLSISPRLCLIFAFTVPIAGYARTVF